MIGQGQWRDDWKPKSIDPKKLNWQNLFLTSVTAGVQDHSSKLCSTSTMNHTHRLSVDRTVAIVEPLPEMIVRQPPGGRSLAKLVSS